MSGHAPKPGGQKVFTRNGSCFFESRMRAIIRWVFGACFLALCSCAFLSTGSALAQSPLRMQATASYHNDVSRPLREMSAVDHSGRHQEREAGENPKIPNSHVDSPD